MTQLTRPAHRSRAFTLIELTVTLALVGMIMATIYVVLFGTIEAQRKLETRVMGSRIGPLLLDAIERDVRQLFIYNIDHGHVLIGEDGKDYGRDADRIMFVAHAPSTSPLVDKDKAIYSNVNEIGYVVTRNEQNDDFMVLWRREDFHVDDEPLEGGKGTPLYRRVTQFDIVYYDQLGEEAEEYDDWDSKEKGLPKAMDISISLEVEPRQVGTALSSEELARRTYSFKRWVTFPQDAKYAVAVRPAVPVPPEEYEQGLGDTGGGQGGGDGGGEGGSGGRGGSGGSGGGSIFGSGAGGTSGSGAGGDTGSGSKGGKGGKGGGGN